MDLLTAVTDPDIAYLLGFMWADGSLEVVNKKGGAVSTMNFRMGGIETDFILLEPMMKRLGEFHVWKMAGAEKPIKRRPQLHFTSHDQDFCKFLHQNDFHIKSKVSPTKLLKHIPDALHSAFWHGFFDGDGSLTIIRSYSANCVNFAGSHDQEWTDLEERLKKLGVKYKISRAERTIGTGAIHRYSKVIIEGLFNIRKLVNYLYELPTIGLTRKRDKAIELHKWIDQSKMHRSINLIEALSQIVMAKFGYIIKRTDIQKWEDFEPHAPGLISVTSTEKL